MELAYITGGVLAWARERSGLTKNQLAAELGIDQGAIASWEEGTEYPPFGRAQHIAHVLKIPFGYLFLSKAPSQTPPIPDLRTVSANRRPPSPDFIELLDDVLVKHDWYLEYVRQHGGRPLSFVGKYTITSPMANVVADVRAQIRPDELRREAPNWAEYLRLLVARAEQNGMIVMRGGVVRNTTRALSVAEFRGFAISDRYAPLIFINSKDAQAAQIFTFAHELVHLWVGQSGISNPDPADRLGGSQFGLIEDFCNQAAAELLVPTPEFDAQWTRSSGDAEERTENLAKRFKVSIPVILRRAMERNAITRNEFFKLLRDHNNRIRELEGRSQEDPAEGTGGGNFYNTFFARHSRRFSRAVTSAVRGGQLTPLEAARMLSVRTSTISKLAERIGS